MSSIAISLITFCFLFAGALLGLLLSRYVPKAHISDHSRESIKIGTGLIATLTALVLGLLVSSAKGSYDTMSDEIKQSSVTFIVLNHQLEKYGPETKGIREMLLSNLRFALNKIWPAESKAKIDIQAVENIAGVEGVRDKILELKPQNENQRVIQASALQICSDLAHSRWLLIEQAQNTLPTPFLVVLIFWLVIFFISFGLMSPNNGTVVAVMLVCTISMAGAIFLVLELSHPLQSTIKISSAPLHKALEHMSL